jgi:hypothetical protein
MRKREIGEIVRKRREDKNKKPDRKSRRGKRLHY